MSAEILAFPLPPSRLAIRLERFTQGRSVLLAIWALYFALRVAALLAPVRGAAPVAEGTGPGWPLTIALLEARFGAGPATTGLFNLACALSSAALMLSLARRLFASEAGARLALLALALSPAAIGQASQAGPGAFHAALFALAIWIIASRSSAWHLVSAGFVLGLAALIEPATLVVLPLVFLAEALARRGFSKRLAHAAGAALLVGAVATATLAPWLVRDPAARQTTLSTLHASPAHALARLKALSAPPFAQSEIARRVPASDSPLMRLARLYDTGLLLGFAVAFGVMCLRRRHEGQRGPGRWLLPYAVSLYPLLDGLLIPARFVALAAMGTVRPFVCLGAGWLGAVLWQRLAERRRTLILRRQRSSLFSKNQ